MNINAFSSAIIISDLYKIVCVHYSLNLVRLLPLMVWLADVQPMECNGLRGGRWWLRGEGEDGLAENNQEEGNQWNRYFKGKKLIPSYDTIVFIYSNCFIFLCRRYQFEASNNQQTFKLNLLCFFLLICTSLQMTFLYNF